MKENFKRMLLDTYAWVEFFLGTEKGEKVEKFLEKEECFSSIISIAETSEWCLKNRFRADFFIERIKRLSKVLKLNEDIVKFAGKINFENKKTIKNWGMIDSLIYATARIYGLKFLTGDKHFEDLMGVEML